MRTVSASALLTNATLQFAVRSHAAGGSRIASAGVRLLWDAFVSKELVQGIHRLVLCEIDPLCLIA